MSVLEAAAVLLGFLGVWLTVRQDWRCWPVGLVSVLAFAVLFWQARLYGAASLQLVYAGTQLYGWWAWRHGGEGGGSLAVGRAPRRLLAALLAAGLAATALLATALGRLTDAALPLTDAGTTSFSLVAQLLLTRKWIENWLLWIVVDAVYVVMYLTQALHLTAALYVAFLVLAVLGWRSWSKDLTPARQDGMPGRRVVVIGPECTGKTTLARELADRYGVRWVPEYARAFVNQVRRPVRFDDVDAIGRGQRAAEDEAMRDGRPLLVLDTDLVSTFVYSHHYYGDCPPWIEGAVPARLSDLYLLLGTDVPWQPEGYLREQPERREELYARFRQALEDLGARVVEVRGTWDQRRSTAIAAIDTLLEADGQDASPSP